MKTFCNTNNTTEEFLDQAMDWDCWPECDVADTEPPDDFSA